MTSPAVSVVITAHNAAHEIGPCIASVVAQTVLPPGGMEIVLVDDRSTDGTADVARRAGGDALRLITIEAPAGNGLTTRQEALARGFAAARGEVALTLDADGIVPTDWAATMSAPILEGRADAVAGPVFFTAERGLLGVWQTVDVSHYLQVGRVLNALGFKGGALFGNFAFRRSLFEKVGGFSGIGFTLTEDLALSQALKGAGARFVFGARGGISVSATTSWSVLVERAKRVSSGGLSALSVAIGGWMASLPILALLALAMGGAFATALAIRYLLGVSFTAAALVRVGKFAYLPAALLYEPLAVLIGLVVMARLTRSRKIEWGGQLYDR